MKSLEGFSGLFRTDRPIMDLGMCNTMIATVALMPPQSLSQHRDQIRCHQRLCTSYSLCLCSRTHCALMKRNNTLKYYLARVAGDSSLKLKQFYHQCTVHAADRAHSIPHAQSAEETSVSQHDFSVYQRISERQALIGCQRTSALG